MTLILRSRTAINRLSLVLQSFIQVAFTPPFKRVIEHPCSMLISTKDSAHFENKVHGVLCASHIEPTAIKYYQDLKQSEYHPVDYNLSDRTDDS